MNRVVVTGMGLVTPLGLGRERSWQALLDSRSGIKPEPGTGVLSAQLDNFAVPPETRLLSMTFLAAAEALQDSGIAHGAVDPERFGCSVSVSKPNLVGMEQGNLLDLFLPSTVGQQLYKIFKLAGPLQNVKAACATGTDAVILAAEWIRHGLCDVVLAGAAESSLHPLYRAAFQQMGVLALRRVCPFDRWREGFALGEGAAVLVLERKDGALLRGARIYGEVAGWAMANDAHHPVAFEPSGETIARAIRKALDRAGMARVDYINAHGTATLLNDVIETRAIKKALGPAAPRVSISSTKAAAGHLLGASGAVEIAFSLLAMRDGMVPPTLNLLEPDPECDLDYTPQVRKNRVVDTALSLSFGFGGQIGIIAVTK